MMMMMAQAHGARTEFGLFPFYSSNSRLGRAGLGRSLAWLRRLVGNVGRRPVEDLQEGRPEEAPERAF